MKPDAPTPSTVKAILTYLAGADYPCTRADLVRVAEAHGACADSVGHLRRLPDQTYYASAGVAQALRGEA